MMTTSDIHEWQKELGKLLAVAAEILGERITIEVPTTPRRPIVLVAGSLKAGKSSLINDLLGKRLISDGQAITDTRVYGRIVYGPDGEACLVHRDGTKEVVELPYAQALLSKAGGEDPELDDLDRVELAATHDLLRQMDIEDSPGTEDPAAGDRFVRTDVAARALGAAMVVYLVPAMPGFTLPDWEFMQCIIKNKTPFCVVFSRYDMLDETEDQDSSEALIIKSMRKWPVVFSPEQVRFVSSYWHRKGEAEKGGIDALRDMLAGTSGHLPAYQAAATCRSFARAVTESKKEISEHIAAREGAEEGVTTQNEMRALRTLTGNLRTIQVVTDEFLDALNAAHRKTLQNIKGACLQRKDVATLYKTTFGPSWQEMIVDAAKSFNEQMKELSARIACRFESITPVSAPAVVISGLPSLSTGPKLPTLAQSAKDVHDEIAFQIWVSRTASAVDDAISRLDHAMMDRCRNCANSVDEQLRAAGEEKLTGQAIERLHSLKRLRDICQQLTAMEERAQVAADELVR